MIEQTLDSFGIKAKVGEILLSEEYADYVLKLGTGTKLSTLRNLTRELAMAVASPTGQITWQLLDSDKLSAVLRIPSPTDDQIEGKATENEKKNRIIGSSGSLFETISLLIKNILLLPFSLSRKKGYLSTSCDLIEKTLDSLGVIVRVKEINVHERDYEFLCDIAMGTRLSKLEKASGKLAEALSSPTGKVSWQLPVPGKSLVALKVPRSAFIK